MFGIGCLGGRQDQSESDGGGSDCPQWRNYWRGVYVALWRSPCGGERGSISDRSGRRGEGKGAVFGEHDLSELGALCPFWEDTALCGHDRGHGFQGSCDRLFGSLCKGKWFGPEKVGGCGD